MACIELLLTEYILSESILTIEPHITCRNIYGSWSQNDIIMAVVGKIGLNNTGCQKQLKESKYFCQISPTTLYLSKTNTYGLFSLIQLSCQQSCKKGCPHGVMVKAMDCRIVVREFVLQSRYYVHFRTNTLG